MKLCIECQHYVPALGHIDEARRAEFARCAKIPLPTRVMARVDGRQLPTEFMYCESARADHGPCGEDAKLFEPKKERA